MQRQINEKPMSMKETLTNGSQNLQFPRTARASPPSLHIAASKRLNGKPRRRRRRRRQLVPANLVLPRPPPAPFHHYLSRTCSFGPRSGVRTSIDSDSIRCGIVVVVVGFHHHRQFLLGGGFWLVLGDRSTVLVLVLVLVLHE